MCLAMRLSPNMKAALEKEEEEAEPGNGPTLNELIEKTKSATLPIMIGEPKA